MAIRSMRSINYLLKEVPPPIEFHPILACALAAALSFLNPDGALSRCRSFPLTSSTATLPPTYLSTPLPSTAPGTTPQSQVRSSPSPAGALSRLSVAASLFCVQEMSPLQVQPPMPSKSRRGVRRGLGAMRPDPRPTVHPNFSRYCCPNWEVSTRGPSVSFRITVVGGQSCPRARTGKENRRTVCLCYGDRQSTRTRTSSLSGFLRLPSKSLER